MRVHLWRRPAIEPRAAGEPRSPTPLLIAHQSGLELRETASELVPWEAARKLEN